ncbi:MAG TPA: ABC transporter ATP-binding protein [Clostridia bacterium]|nr:ABC transporter ATP-binding protein [Clostridia bacterium]
MYYLAVEAIEKSYNNKKILDKISFQVNKGEFLSILGESGCGKTTLLKIIAGLIKQDSGKITLEQCDISNTLTQKRSIAMVFQDYLLFPHLNARDNVEFSLKMKGMEEKKKRSIALEYLELVQLSGMGDKYPHELSGGQKQRVAIARALVAEPKAILMDEPFSNLDTNLRSEMCEFIKRLQKQIEMTTIMVTHDRKEAMQLSDNILVLHDGTAAQCGTPAEVYKSPADLFVARFMGDLNLIEGYRRSGRFYSQIGLEFSDEGIDKNIIYAVRPESIGVSSIAAVDYIKGVIQSKFFMGEKMNYSVLVNGTPLNILALSGNSEYNIGQEVFINIPVECIMSGE